MNNFRKYFRGRQDVSDEIKTNISFIKYYLQTSNETDKSQIKYNGKIFWLNRDEKNIDYESYRKHTTERKTASDHVSYLVDNWKCLPQHEKLHPLRSRKGEWISLKMYRDIE